MQEILETGLDGNAVRTKVGERERGPVLGTEDALYVGSLVDGVADGLAVGPKTLIYTKMIETQLLLHTPGNILQIGIAVGKVMGSTLGMADEGTAVPVAVGSILGFVVDVDGYEDGDAEVAEGVGTAVGTMECRQES